MLLLIVLSLAWYLLADRFTPYTQQARVGAFVIPVTAEVAGQVIRVNVRNNQTSRPAMCCSRSISSPIK